MMAAIAPSDPGDQRVPRPAPSSSDATAARIIGAALACVAEYGVSKTTLEDIASRTGCSRATLYRYFPGKQALISGVVQHEVRRVAAALDAEARQAPTLEDALVALIGGASREFHGHDALRTVLAVEPEVLLPRLVFRGGDRLLAVASSLLRPALEHFLPPERAAEAVEWLCRVITTYLFRPSPHVSLTDPESVRRLVRTYILPGLQSREAELIPTT